MLHLKSPTVKLLVSVVVPCLNRADLLRPTINSILNQSYPRIECIVMDGGSNDGTVEVLRSYGDRIIWRSEPDRGHADAINKGWQLSKGEILAWLNADDCWTVPGSVGTAVEYFTKDPTIDVIYGRAETIDRNGRHVGWSHAREWDLEEALRRCDHLIPQPAAFIRRDSVIRAGWLDVSMETGKDHDLWLQISLIGGRLQFVPETLALERSTPGTWSQRGDEIGRGKVTLTRKYFASPNVPSSIRRLKSLAMSSAYLKAAEYSWNDGRHWVVAARYLLQAIGRNPKNVVSGYRMARMMAATVIVERERLGKPFAAKAAALGRRLRSR